MPGVQLRTKRSIQSKCFPNTLRWYLKETLYSKKFRSEARNFLFLTVEFKTSNQFRRRNKKFIRQMKNTHLN